MELEKLRSKYKSYEVTKAKRRLQGSWKLQLCEVLILTPVILVIIGLFSIPTILFALPPPEAEVTVLNPTNPSACLQVETYSGEVCSETLASLQACFSGVTTLENLNIPSLVDQEAGERDAATFVNGLPFLNPNPQCREAIEPFICLSIFTLCDPDGDLHTITREDCLELRDNICAELWSLAVGILGAGALPVCEDLLDITNECVNSSLDSPPPSNPINTTSSVVYHQGTSSPENSQDVVADIKSCSDGFFFDANVTNICRPICGGFSPTPLFLQILYKISIVVGIIAAVIVVILALTVQREKLRVAPLVFMVYLCASVFILLTTVTVGLFINPGLFCGSKDLIIASETMTPYCTITGLVSTYTLLQFPLWANLFSMFMFWGAAFPFSFMRLKKSGRIHYAHIISVVLVVVLPLPCALVHLKGGLIVIMTPPVACFGANIDYSFYLFVLPVSVSLAIVSSLLVLTFWTIFKVFVVKKLLARKKMVNVGKGELKIAFVIIYSIIVGVMGLVVYIMAHLVRVGSTPSNFEKYLICESAGTSADCSLDMTIANLILVTHILVSFLPVVMLLFVCDLHAFKRKLTSKTHESSPHASNKSFVHYNE